MSTTYHAQPIQHVHRARGATTERTLCCADPEPDPFRAPTIADLVPVTEIMTREITCAMRDLGVDRIIDLLVTKQIGCVPVVEEAGYAVGLITKQDLLQVLAKPHWRPTCAHELMMPLALTLGPRATVAQAAALMAYEGIHHVAIGDDDGRLIGIVSALDITRWLARNDGFLGSDRTPP